MLVKYILFHQGSWSHVPAAEKNKTLFCFEF